jgi:glycosyltransferase involved in cell wall biosynthesis
LTARKAHLSSHPVSPTVSVIIPTFNRWPLLGEAVESVLAQDYVDYELIVVDDGSTDETAGRLNQFGSRLRFFTQANRGVSSARNLGARHARGDYLAFLDSDDLWLPQKLAVQIVFMMQNPTVQICQTNEIWIRHGVRVNPKARHQKPSGDIFLPSLELCLVSPSAVMLRRDLFEQLCGFDENFPVCEDYDLWLRIGVDHPVPLIDDALVVKRGGHDDQLSRSMWGMDRYRVLALQKLMRLGLNGERRGAVLEVLRRKVGVLATGARKRGKATEAAAYEEILAGFAQEHDVGARNSQLLDGEGFSSANAGALA